MKKCNFSKRANVFKYKIAEKRYLSNISETYIAKCCIVKKLVASIQKAMAHRLTDSQASAVQAGMPLDSG